jgi:MFS family permease
MDKRTRLKPLGNPEFRFFLSMRVCLTIAYQIQAVVCGWEIFKITQDPLSLGFIGLAEAIPAISIALYAGHLADKSNKRNLLLWTVAGFLFCSTGLTFVTSESVRATTTDGFTVNMMYLFIFLSGFARGFYSPTGFSFIPQLVPREQLSHATTLNSTFWQFSAILGPAMGGFLYAGFGMSGAMYTVLAFSVLSFISTANIGSKPIVQIGNKERVADRLKEGLRFVFGHKIILNALALDMFSVLFGGAVALLPIFADQILMVGPQGLGMLRAAPSVGAVITMSWLSLRHVPGKAGTTLLWAVAGFGVSIFLFGISTNFYFSLFVLFLSGAFDSVSVIIRANIIQLLTPDEMRGRVSAVNSMFIGSSNEIGAFESGVTAKWMGAVGSVVFGGTMTLLIVGYTAVKAKTLKRFSY